MPTFSREPPARGTNHALTLYRVPAGAGRKGIITASDLLGCWTHWWGGRTQPCEDEDCKACTEGMPRRWHAYISAWTAQPSYHYLLELTRNAIEPLLDYRKEHGTLRGCYYEARRSGPAKNSRLLLSCRPADLAGLKLPPEPHLIHCLAVIWSIPAEAMRVQNANGRPPETAIDHAAIAAALAAPTIHQGSAATSPRAATLSVFHPDPVA
jgi:hypothetical protein